ncbi:MAG TPA: hypothetical protein VHJ58_20570, partial [Vicinamibacterales bacterium]|nr:hypothetical protein [Vicinamibacterales bacterium]
PLHVAHVRERRVADELLDAAAQLGARHLAQGSPCGDTGQAMSRRSLEDWLRASVEAWSVVTGRRDGIPMRTDKFATWAAALEAVRRE